MKTFSLTGLVLLALAAGAVRIAAADDPLDAAKSLYLSAAYEEALAALTNLPAGVDVDQADKFRALCFLALNRSSDAQGALEKLATRRPLLKFDDAESPKLVMMFRDARAKVLPAAARNMYASAKSSFEKGELAKAGEQFADLLSLLSEKDLAGQAAFSDLKMLAEGFAKLTNQQVTAEREAELQAAQKAAAAQAAQAQIAAAADSNRIYASIDSDVIAPVAIEQTVPQWTPPAPNMRNQEFSGVLEIVIDETGVVTSAVMAQRVNVIYDQLLLSATKRWRYRPAQRNGKPVKYRKLVNIVLRPIAPPVTDHQSDSQ
jgi:TonB family protein